MAEFILPRTGAAPLQFSGELIAQSIGEPPTSGKKWQRYHNLAIYRSDAGEYILAIAYRCTRDKEPDKDMAYVFAHPRYLADYLAQHNPTSYVVGWPNTPRHRERRLADLADIDIRFRHQVSEVLDREEFREVL